MLLFVSIFTYAQISTPNVSGVGNIPFLVLDLSNLSLYDFSAFFQLIATFAIACVIIDSLPHKNNFSKFMEKYSIDSINDKIIDIENKKIISDISKTDNKSMYLRYGYIDIEKYIKEKTRNNPVVLSCQCISAFIYCIIYLLISPFLKIYESLYIPFFLYSIFTFSFILYPVLPKYPITSPAFTSLPNF